MQVKVLPCIYFFLSQPLAAGPRPLRPRYPPDNAHLSRPQIPDLAPPADAIIGEVGLISAEACFPAHGVGPHHHCTGGWVPLLVVRQVAILLQWTF
jgi:hypothetical protein